MITAVERKRKVPGPNGQMVDATEIGFRGTGEYWNEYLVDDGTVIRMKIVVTNIYRLDGQYDPEGQPAYVVKSNNVMAVSAPDDLLRGEGSV